MPTFELQPSQDTRRAPPEHDGLTGDVLAHNARWFTQVRWGVAAVFLALGLLCTTSRELLTSLGLRPLATWPYGIAAVLVLANTAFVMSLHRLRHSHDRSLFEANIWTQIALDLVVVTVMVHFVGSTVSFMAFTYLFHITLACIFFPPATSLLVTVLASALYVGCVGLDLAGILPSSTLFTDQAFCHGHALWPQAVQAASAIFVWFFVWYLVSTLSQSVRERDRRLDQANRELLAADEEKNRLVLRTTHDLKAPFSGIESNIQLLKFKYWDDVTPAVRQIIEQIETRGHALSLRIRDILTLGQLKSESARVTTPGQVPLHDVLRSVVSDLEETARHRNVTIDLSAPCTSCLGNQRQLHILFANLVTNAILYSEVGGSVSVTATEEKDCITVTVTDHGIGIEEEALPRVFDEYYRTSDGARFNKLSTGLGLTIVKRVAQNLGLRIRVTSERHKGTSMAVMIPRGVDAPN